MRPLIFTEDVRKAFELIPIAIVEISFGKNISRDANNANEAFYALTGSTREQYMEEEKSGDPRNVLLQEDLVRVFNEFKYHAQEKTNFRTQYRVVHMNGSIVWLDVFASYTGKMMARPLFYVQC